VRPPCSGPGRRSGEGKVSRRLYEANLSAQHQAWPRGGPSCPAQQLLYTSKLTRVRQRRAACWRRTPAAAPDRHGENPRRDCKRVLTLPRPSRASPIWRFGGASMDPGGRCRAFPVFGGSQRRKAPRSQAWSRREWWRPWPWAGWKTGLRWGFHWWMTRAISVARLIV